MSSKPNFVEDVLPDRPQSGFLQDHARLRVHGAEAFAFLQRQCMSDLRRLEVDGSMQWSGLLSAKGRLLFLFRLLRRGEQDFLLLASGGSAAELAAELRRFVFRAKLRIEAEDMPTPATLGGVSAPEGAWIGWDEGRWIGADASDPAPAADPLDDLWQHVDTRRGIPQIDAALRDRFTPQMLSLQRLGAFSLNKGCYPGQEIVARTHYLGQQKRELRVLLGEHPLRRGDTLYSVGQTAGEVIQVSRCDARLALAVVSREADPQACFGPSGDLLRTLPDADHDG